MFKIFIASLAFISLISTASATPLPPQATKDTPATPETPATKTTNLFVCDTDNGKQYATSIDQFPGKCSKAPDMPSDWHPLMIVKDNNAVIYIDIKHVKWKDRVAEVAFVIVPVDSSKAVFKDASSIPQFDVITRRYLYCDKAQQQSFAVEMYRNFRKNPELIKKWKGSQAADRRKKYISFKAR